MIIGFGIAVSAFICLCLMDWGPGQSEEVPDAGPNLGE